MSLRRWILPLVAALALHAGPPREVVRPEAAPQVLSEGAIALDEAFRQAFSEEQQPERVLLDYADQTWELDWEDWWAYRQGDLDLQGLLAKVRIRTKVEAAPRPSAAVQEAPTRALPVAWIAGGVGVLLLVGLGVGILLLARRKRPPRRSAGPPPVPPPFMPPLPAPQFSPTPLPPPLPTAQGASSPSSLHFLSGPLAGRSVPLGQGARVGRERDCHLVLDDPSVSRHHADLVPGPQGWILRDLGSSNGTSINGQRIQGEAPLRGGEILQFGNVKARLEAE